ncbi:hypothetical protein C8J57DRAFT_1458011 [Mycena rebaudengoi]|nr:hypothetical protein C8J57DRAFT_1458011 [Mycena rebaudengoi]
MGTGVEVDTGMVKGKCMIKSNGVVIIPIRHVCTQRRGCTRRTRTASRLIRRAVSSRGGEAGRAGYNAEEDGASAGAVIPNAVEVEGEGGRGHRRHEGKQTPNAGQWTKTSTANAVLNGLRKQDGAGCGCGPGLARDEPEAEARVGGGGVECIDGRRLRELIRKNTCLGSATVALPALPRQVFVPDLKDDSSAELAIVPRVDDAVACHLRPREVVAVTE